MKTICFYDGSNIDSCSAAFLVINKFPDIVLYDLDQDSFNENDIPWDLFIMYDFAYFVGYETDNLHVVANKLLNRIDDFKIYIFNDESTVSSLVWKDFYSKNLIPEEATKLVGINLVSPEDFFYWSSVYKTI